MAAKSPSPSGTTTAEEAETVCELDGTPFSVYYGQLQHQQNMLQDSVRTGTYQYAFTSNAADFAGSTVLDVGTGTGLLAFFAVQAGAAKVYAVEQASRMASLARRLVVGNGMSGVVEVLEGAVEEVQVEGKVDIIVSEPLGFLLVHERMLESFVAARDRFLRPGGKMMPSASTIFCAPFTDAVLHSEQRSKSFFWGESSFYGIDLRALAGEAVDEYMGQAVVGYFSTDCLISTDRSCHRVDFHTVTAKELQEFEIPLHFVINRTALLHGLGCWFDVYFIGSTAHVTLPTGPDHPGTHWYQCRLLLKNPIAVNASQSISGNLRFVATSKVSYTVTMTLTLDGTDITSTTKIHLQDQMYHYLQSGSGGGYEAGNGFDYGVAAAPATSPDASSPPPPPAEGGGTQA